MHLDAAATVGVRFVNQNDEPIEGVVIDPSIEYKKRDEDLSQLGMGDQFKSDANGNWVFTSAPQEPGQLSVELTHPDYMPLRQMIQLSAHTVDANGVPKEKTVLDSGYTVSGKIVDEKGNPIAGATVRTLFGNIRRGAVSDENGLYRLAACRSGKIRLIVAAKNHAPVQRQIDIDAQGAREIPNTDFQLAPGGKVVVRVTEKDGTPIPKACIFFQNWRDMFSSLDERYGLEMDSSYTDENGVWVWNEAPPDGANFDICADGKMQLSKQRLVPREEEYLFAPPPELNVSGTVTDAETGRPIAKMTIIPASYSPPYETKAFLSHSERYESSDGKYRFTRISSRFAHGFRIEAEGYVPYQSRPIKDDEGTVVLNVEMEKGQNINPTVLDGDGIAISGADVLLGTPGTQINISGGKIGHSTYCDRVKTDAQGRFLFPPQVGHFELIVLHPEGVAWVFCDAKKPPKEITLEPWACIEGTLKIGDPKSGNERLCLYPFTQDRFPERTYLSVEERQERSPVRFDETGIQVDTDGKFRIPHVLPGKVRVARELTYMRTGRTATSTSSHGVTMDLIPGEVRQNVVIGGSGRTVIGRLSVPEDSGVSPDWEFALVQGDVEIEGDKAWERDSVACTVEKDGSFRLEAVPPCTLHLTASLSAKGPENVWAEQIGSASRELSIPTEPSDEPIDLGDVQIQLIK